jgi:hypothetical protein
MRHAAGLIANASPGAMNFNPVAGICQYVDRGISLQEYCDGPTGRACANLSCGARVVLEAIGPDELELLLLSFRDEERALS